MPVRTKICGIRSVDALRAAGQYGAHAVGLVFARSPRNISVQDAARLRSMVPPFMSVVAVFKHPSREDLHEVLELVKPDAIQVEPEELTINFVRKTGSRFLPVLHDDGSVEQQLKDLEVSGVPFAGVILEAAGRGGRGIRPDWDLATDLASRTKLVLAGGLNASNVRDAIERVRPWAVDVSSGVESAPGVKDPELIASFLEVVHTSTPSTPASTGPVP